MGSRLAMALAPLSIARRDTSVSGTRAVVSSQQLMENSAPCGRSRCCAARSRDHHIVMDAPRNHSRAAAGKFAKIVSFAPSRRNRHRVQAARDDGFVPAYLLSGHKRMATAYDLRRIAMSLDGTVEAPHFDRVAFKVARIYATLPPDGLTANLM